MDDALRAIGGWLLMPVNDQDVRALTYLAKRLRDETHGAGKWDEAGIAAKCREMIGQNLALTIERVCRHAADTDAKTPGAILRPFVPPLGTVTVAPEKVDPVDRCSRCCEPRDRCVARWSADHEFTPSHRKPEVDTEARVQAIRQDVACTELAPPSPEVAAVSSDERESSDV